MTKEFKPNEYSWFPIDKLVKADWNYKTDNPALLEKLKANIKRNGQIENIIVRELETGFFEVVNGNHRFDALIQLSFDKVYCFNLGKITLAQAQRIAIETNETKFASDNIKLADLIKEISSGYDIADLTETMPYSNDELEDFVKLTDFDWEQFSTEATDDVLNDTDGIVQEATKELSITLSLEEYGVWQRTAEALSKDDKSLLLYLLSLANITA